MKIKYEAVLNFFPPSVNKLYTPMRRGKKLSTEGRVFKTKAKAALLKAWLFNKPLNAEAGKALILKFYFPSLFTKGWPKTAKFRYKKKDASNYVKLIEDVISDCTGIDDSYNISYQIEKFEDKDKPRIEIIYKDAE